MNVFEGLVSISELKELARKRPIDDPVRQVILASDDQLDSHGYANLVKICLRLMSEKEARDALFKKMT
ncbi:MAG: hypothetical protein HYY67_00650 [Thaumarchaeota archaeon]|nr:hypothetical protein [Nitrososphaerota archaeon]